MAASLRTPGWRRFIPAGAAVAALTVAAAGCDLGVGGCAVESRALVFVRTAYAGEVPFAELWDLVQREPVSFHAVLDDGVRSLRVGPLLRTGSSDWQEVCS